MRKNSEDTLFVAVNRSEEEVAVSLDGELITVKPWQFVLK